ncbi:MAG: hypothetical protein LBG23_02155 [Endomicrobium sp.]|jgi:hypothetical protein|nr:hypothetical protein [Endomicrobium sp.]
MLSGEKAKEGVDGMLKFMYAIGGEGRRREKERKICKKRVKESRELWFWTRGRVKRECEILKRKSRGKSDSGRACR